jgi:drug/metabolite transporter (DMT)-like permease
LLLLWGLNQVAAKAALPEIPRSGRRRRARSAARCWSGSGPAGAASRCSRATAPVRAAARRLLLRRRVRLHLHRARIHDGVAHGRLPVPVAVRRRARHAVHRPSERLAWPQLLGLSIAFVAVASAFAEGFSRPAAGDRQWIGDALGLLAAALWGATTLAIRASRLTSASAEKTLLYQLAVSGVLLALAALAGARRCRRTCRRWPGARSRSRSSSSRS